VNPEFPKGFLWGISMAAFQYEMGASPDSVDPNSDWYVWLHDRQNVEKGVVSGDVPENGPGYYDLFRVDHGWACWLGLNAWRGNVEWSRIFPKSTRDVKVHVDAEGGAIRSVEVSEEALKRLDEMANKAAVNRYREIFEDLKCRGLKLILNLYHWPLPLWVHDPIKVRDTGGREGPRGWLDAETVVEFAKFAAYVAWKFGDLADMWCTMNEPNVVWSIGYTGGNFPPGLNDYTLSLAAAVNLVQAHARAYDQLKEHAGRDAQVGIIYAVTPAEPAADEDREAAETANRVMTHWYFEAITEGRLAPFGVGGERREDLKGRVDWIGINYYSRLLVKADERPPGYRVLPGYGFACKPASKSEAGLPTSDFGWEIYPQGLRKAVNMIKRYGKPMMITENGIADASDRHRSWYIVSHLYQLLKAIKVDGADVRGYLHWSLIDNLEWASGFKMRFGLIYADMKTKQRYPRPSAYVFRDIVCSNGIPDYLAAYAEYPNILSGA
jgi:beta-galactosidase